MIKIVADSACDLYSLEAVPYSCVPLTVSTDERSFADTDTKTKEMVDYLASYKGRSYSACPSADAWYEAFGDAKYVICVPITSKLSGSYNSARIAAEDYMEDHPDRRVYVIDSLSAGPGMRILIYKLKDYILECCSFDEIISKIEKYKDRTELGFCLASLKNFANNGRVSPAAAKISMALNLRIIGKAECGELKVLDKVRGEKRGIAAVVEFMKEQGYAGGRVLVDHCNNREGAETVCRMIRESFPGARTEIKETGFLCSFYAENGGLLCSFEVKR